MYLFNLSISLSYYEQNQKYEYKSWDYYFIHQDI